MSAHHVRFALIVSVVAGAGTVARAQGLDVSQPLERIEDLPELEAPTLGDAEEAAKSDASPASSAEYSKLPPPKPTTLRRRVLSSIKRHLEVQVGADIDDNKRYGTYVDATGKYNATEGGGVLLLPELTVRGDNLSSTAMGTHGLRFDGTLGLVLAPSQILDNRLMLAFVGDGWYMASQGTDQRGLAVAAKASIKFCPPILCRDRARDEEAVRVRTSYSSATAGSDSTGIEFAYAPKWAYRIAAAPGGALAPERIAATPIVAFKNTDMGWATTLGLDLSIDLTLAFQLGVQLRHTLQGSSATAAATLGGLFVSYHPGG